MGDKSETGGQWFKHVITVIWTRVVASEEARSRGQTPNLVLTPNKQELPDGLNEEKTIRLV